MGIISTRLTASTTLGVNSNIPVGSVIHKNCTKLFANGNSWTVKGVGYFKASANVTVAPTTAGDITVTMYDNGTAVATASGVTATNGDAVTLPLQYLGLNECACCNHTITLDVSVASTVTESSMIIQRGEL